MSVPGTYSSMYMGGFNSDVQFVGASTIVSANATTTGITPTVHASTLTGDFVLLQLTMSQSTGISIPSGWTQVSASPDSTPNSTPNHMWLLYRFYNGTVPLLVPGGSANMSCVVSSWRNVNTTTPLDVASVSNRDQDNRNLTASGVTTVTPRAMIVVCSSANANTSSGGRMGDFSNASLTNAAELFDLSTTVSSHAQAGYAGLKVTAGAVSNTTSLITTSTSDNWMSFTVALRPA